MRCLVTGASSPLGSFLTQKLIEKKHTVTVLVRPQSDLWRLAGVLDQVNVIQTDLKELSKVEERLLEAAAETVFHLAWQGTRSEELNERRHAIVNVGGTLELFDLVRRAGCRCWLGMGSVFEDSQSVYGISKNTVCQLTGKLCEVSGMRFLWTRLFAAYGPKDHAHKLIPYIIQTLLQGDTAELTEGKQKWDYLYNQDAAEALIQLAETQKAQGVFDLGSGQAYEVRRIAGLIHRRIGTGTLKFGAKPYGKDQPMHLQADISKLKAVTGWTPRVSLEEGLDLTVDWYRNETTAKSGARPS